MENLQGNLERHVNSLSQESHSFKKGRQWTILLVNDYGKVISFSRFKEVVIISASMLFVAIIAAVILFFLYNKTQSNNKKFQAMLSASQEKANFLKNENEILMANLVTSGYKVNENSTRKHEIRPEKFSTKKGSTTTDTKTNNQFSKEHADKNQALTANNKDKKSAIVSVNNFNVYYEKDKSVFRVQYIIKTINLKAKIDGYTFAILKNNEANQDEWLTLPSKKTGQAFLISNFRKITLKATKLTNPNQFNKATVFVFSKNRELLLEKDFPVLIQNYKSSPQNNDITVHGSRVHG
ncbi:MAG: hypothetical protein HF982_05135 [Desulfobacteraceae bacterium]|nr:hypothetical protein [Desulfobacteraceae bacterium]MBC2718962.1 hypothetical protein [Desulfobacteraceae bacterium]